MSDPVSSRDVEDVLSSIRRLVSEEAKGNGAAEGDTIVPDIHEAAENAAETALAEIVQQVTGEPPSNDESPEEPETPPVSFRHQAARRAAPNAADKLVLTADFRVAESGDSQDDDGGDAPQATGESDPGPGSGAGVLHLHPVTEAEGAAEAEVSDEPDPQETPEEADSSDESTGETPRPAPFAFASEDTLFERARQAMAGDAPDAPAPAAEQTPFAPEPPAEPEQAEAQESARMGDAAEEPPAEAETAEKPEVETSRPDASPFSATGGFAKAAPATESDEDPPERINFVEEEESILDEDTLRDMVSEMVRQELQGELGDRITRNVRKLVRREIQRALASRAFE